MEMFINVSHGTREGFLSQELDLLADFISHCAFKDLFDENHRDFLSLHCFEASDLEELIVAAPRLTNRIFTKISTRLIFCRGKKCNEEFMTTLYRGWFKQAGSILRSLKNDPSINCALLATGHKDDIDLCAATLLIKIEGIYIVAFMLVDGEERFKKAYEDICALQYLLGVLFWPEDYHEEFLILGSAYGDDDIDAQIKEIRNGVIDWLTSDYPSVEAWRDTLFKAAAGND